MAIQSEAICKLSTADDCVALMSENRKCNRFYFGSKQLPLREWFDTFYPANQLVNFALVKFINVLHFIPIDISAEHISTELV